ncbi:MAG: ABC transporter ATP-binding protein [Sphingomonadaceae bacterium]
MTTAEALAAFGLSRRFGRVQALDSVDLVVPGSSLVAVLGPAGAGKTTLLRVIAGLTRADAGTVAIRGRDVTDLEPKDRNVAMIFDTLALYPDRTGLENIAHPLRIRRMPAAEIERRVRETAASLRISHLLSRLPRAMSGGERQRVALARALVRDPALFLLDEPFSSLDAQLRVELRTELRRLQLEQGHAFVLATPDQVEALAVADHVVFLGGGRVRQVASPQDLYDRPADRVVARFVGSPEINILPAEFDPAEGGRIRLASIVAAAGTTLARTLGPVACRFEAGLRPEHVALGPPTAEGSVAEVVDVERLGMKAVVTVVAASYQIRSVVSAATGAALRLGARVSVTPDVSRLIVFDSATGRRIG